MRAIRLLLCALFPILFFSASQAVPCVCVSDDTLSYVVSGKHLDEVFEPEANLRIGQAKAVADDPRKFRLLAYSVDGNRTKEGSNYYIGFDKNDMYNAYAYNVKIVTPQDKDMTILEFERVEADKEQGTIGLKVANAPAADLYLLVADDKRIIMAPGRPVYNRGNFYVRKPEEPAAENLGFVSFETVDFLKGIGHFLRHEKRGLKVTEATATNRKNKVYRQDASWIFEPVK